MKLRVLVLLFSGLAMSSHADASADELTAAQLVETLALHRYQTSAHTPQDRAELEKVARVYDQLVQEYPRSAPVREAYGAFLWQVERRDAAFAQWQAGERLDPKNAGLIFHLGHAWLDRGDAKKACAYFLKAVQLAPAEALYRFNLGNALFLFRHELTDAKAPDADAVAVRAMRQFRLASDLEPGNAEFAKGYAESFYTLRAADWKEALKAWNRYFEIAESKDFANANLARVSLKLGRKAEAQAFLQKIANPQFEALKGRLTRQIDATE